MDLKNLVRSIAKAHGVDDDFVCGLVKTESHWNEYAVRYENHWKYFVDPTKYAHMNGITMETETVLQKISWGLPQVIGGKARELGYDGPLTELVRPEVVMPYACLFMKKLYDRYKSYDYVAAAYNMGTPILDPKTGKFRNQHYVDKVMQNLGG